MPQLAAAAALAAAPSLATYLLQIPSLTSAAASVSSSSFGGASITTTNHAVAVNTLRDDAQGMGPFLVGSTGPVTPAGPPSVGPASVSAAMGRASLVNTLSVPQTWAATARVHPAATALPGARAAVASAAVESMPGGDMFGEALLGTLAGRGVSNTAAKLRRPSVIPRSPAAG